MVTSAADPGVPRSAGRCGSCQCRSSAAGGRAAGAVDVLLFHDPADEDTFDGAARTALFGHLHYRRVEQCAEGTWMMVQGSTGGSGLRALEPDPDPAPIMLSVLYVDRSSHDLVAYDDIRLGGLGNASAEIDRQVLNPPRDTTTFVAPEPADSAGE